MQNENTSTNSLIPGQGPGTRLREARVAAHLSIQDVARKLFLTPSTIEHIENDNYENFPGVTFMRGYLRSYARLVNLPSQEITHAFESLGLVDKPATMPTQEIFRRQSSFFDKIFPWFLTCVLISLIGLIYLWWHSQHETTLEFEAAPHAISNTTTAINLPKPASITPENSANHVNTNQNSSSTVTNNTADQPQSSLPTAIAPSASNTNQNQNSSTPSPLNNIPGLAPLNTNQAATPQLPQTQSNSVVPPTPMTDKPQAQNNQTQKLADSVKRSFLRHDKKLITSSF